MMRNADLQKRVDAIRERVLIEELIAATFPLVGRGRRLESEEHESLAVWPNRQAWQWYSQNVGGDVFDWVMYTENVGFVQAVEILEAEVALTQPTPRKKQAASAIEAAAPWRVAPDRTVGETLVDGRFELWPKYKPVTEATIRRYRLGIGRLHFQDRGGDWYRSRGEFLTVPIFFRGELVAIKGRTLEKKAWICNTGSDAYAWNLDSVAQGSTVWLCENYVDAMLLEQLHPEWIGVAAGGARRLMPREVDYLRERRPALVVVAYDNDMIGQAREPLLGRLQKEWTEEQVRRHIERHGHAPDRLPTPPKPTGPEVCNQLHEVGIKSLLFEWPKEAPPKYDVGAYIQDRKVAP